MHLCYTADDLTVIVLSNNESRSDFIADALSAIALNYHVLLPYPHKEMVGNISLAMYRGKYMMQLTRPPYMADAPIEFVSKNDKLFIHPATGPDKELKPESATKFFFADGTDQQIEFQIDGNTPMRVWHISWGVRRELKSQ
jgi:hypothetical protein